MIWGFWLVAAVFASALIYTLWSGEFQLKGRPEPFNRKTHPTEYWLGVALVAAMTIAVILMAVLAA